MSEYFPWLVNVLFGLLVGLGGYLVSKQNEEIKLLRQRMHDVINHVAEIKATIHFMEKDLSIRVIRIEKYLNGLLKNRPNDGTT